MKKIGFFIGYAPEQPIKNQGIGRLMTFIINGILELENTSVVIATPGWYKAILIDFLQEQELDLDRIEILSTNQLPYLLKIRKLIKNILHLEPLKLTQNPSQLINKQKVEGGLKKVVKLFLKMMFKWLGLTSTPLFILSTIAILLIGLFLSPIILLAGVVLLLLTIKKSPQKFLPAKLQNFIKKYISPIKASFSKVFTLSLRHFKNFSLAHKAYEELRSAEFGKIIKKINLRKDIPVWFVPSLFWPEVKNIHAKKIVAAPDIVFIDFPTLFKDYTYLISNENIRRTLTVADHFICYSDYVKQNHLVDPFWIDPNKVSVIEHGVIELGTSLSASKNASEKEKYLESALQIIQSYQMSELNHNHYLAHLDFSTVKFIFYSSQVRPHKNFLNLIRAYEILLRKKFMQIKLIVTGHIYENKEIAEFIKQRRLQRDIIALTNVPAKVLAALNHLAVCAVNPTLFEGGFPFTFTEAYSVGTPSIMSKIPVVTQHVKDPDLQDKMLFDPYDVVDMVNKIEWGILNRAELLRIQEPLYQQFEKRTWDLVAKEYISVLNQFVA